MALRANVWTLAVGRARAPASGLYSRTMRRIFVSALFAACAAAAQQAPFTVDQVLGAAYPSELRAAPGGGKVAWISNTRGVRNIMVAEAPAYQARAITRYTEDDGQELSGLAWAPDGSAVVFVRGEAPDRNGESPDPAWNPAGAEQAVWVAALDGAAPRKLGAGAAPAVSPRSDRVVFTHGGQVWRAPLRSPGAAERAFHARGQAIRPVWSPDGTRIAFESTRGDHSFIGVYDFTASTLRYLDPGTDNDMQPEWSPDGRRVAFLRIPSSGVREPRAPRRTGEPWSIRVASAEDGSGREIWRARAGAGSVFRDVTARNQLLWAAGRIVFPWEGDGWTHVYTVPETGGAAALLTPGAFEVEDVELEPGGRNVLFSSNQGDADRRHVWRVAVAGAPPAALTSGEGIEWAPVPAGAGAVAFLHADARRPARAALLAAGTTRDLDPTAIPPGFPLDLLTAPRPVEFQAADGMALHAQLFLPSGLKPGARAPAVVFFHGGSRRQMLLGWHPMYYYYNAYALNQYLAASGYVVLSVNYRSGTGYGMEFREAAGYGPAGGSEAADVRGAGLYLRSRADVDPQRIGAWGGSYGGYLTALALARSPDIFSVGVDFHGVHNWATELGIPAGEPDYKVAFDSSPMASVDAWRAPVLLIHGDDDHSVQFNQTVVLAAALRHRGVEVEELIFPDEDHDFLLHRRWRESYAATVRFLDTHLRSK